MRSPSSPQQHPLSGQKSPVGLLYAKASEGAHYVTKTPPLRPEQSPWRRADRGKCGAERSYYLSLGRAGTGRAGAI